MRPRTLGCWLGCVEVPGVPITFFTFSIAPKKPVPCGCVAAGVAVVEGVPKKLVLGCVGVVAGAVVVEGVPKNPVLSASCKPFGVSAKAAVVEAAINTDVATRMALFFIVLLSTLQVPVGQEK